MTDEDDLRCPLCGELATRAKLYGPWLFFCEPCSRSWGHPQEMTSHQAAIELHEAKQKERQ